MKNQKCAGGEDKHLNFNTSTEKIFIFSLINTKGVVCVCVCVRQQDSRRPQVASDPYVPPWRPAQQRLRRMDGWPSADALSSAAAMSSTGDGLGNHGNAEH